MNTQKPEQISASDEVAAMFAESLGQPVNHRNTKRIASDLEQAEPFCEFTGPCCGGDCTHAEADAARGDSRNAMEADFERIAENVRIRADRLMNDAGKAKDINNARLKTALLSLESARFSLMQAQNQIASGPLCPDCGGELTHEAASTDGDPDSLRTKRYPAQMACDCGYSRMA